MKSIYHLILIFSSVILLFTNGCTQENPGNVDTTKYASCCGTEPKIINLHNNTVFVPNVFTPSGDGINDYFYPIAQDTTIQNIVIQDFKIYNMGDTLIFFTQFLYYEFLESGWWNGEVHPDLRIEGYPNIYPGGPFKYAFSIYSKNASGEYDLQDFEGTACLIRCDEDAHVFQTKTGCQFPSQAINGVFLPAAPNRESDCFG